MLLEPNIAVGNLVKVFIEDTSTHNVFYKDRFGTKDTVVGATLTNPPDFKSMIPIKSGEYVLILAQNDVHCKVLYKNKICYVNQNYLVDERCL